MDPRDEDMIDRVLEREGGFVDNPFDKGGPTNKGITLESFKAYLGFSPTLAELRELTTDVARDIYFQMYMVRPGFSLIHNVGLRELLFDAGVNHGPVNAIKMLQRALNNTISAPKLVVDGVLGSKTYDALNMVNPDIFLLRVIAQRLRFYGNIVARNPQQREFAAGWFNRMADVVDVL